MLFNDVFKKTMVLLLVLFLALGSFPFYILNADEENSTEPIETVEEKSETDDPKVDNSEVEDATTEEQPVEPKEEDASEESQEAQTEPEKTEELDQEKVELTKQLEDLELELSKLKEQEKALIDNSDITEEDSVVLDPDDNIELEEPEKISESEYLEIKEKLEDSISEEPSMLKDIQLRITEVTAKIEEVKLKLSNLDNKEEDGLDLGPLSSGVTEQLMAAQVGNTKASVSMTWLEGNVISPNSYISQDWKRGSKDIRARVNYSLESEEEFKPGELEITIPRYIYDDRDGKPIGEITLGVPRFPNTRQPIAYIEKEDTITFVNTRSLPKSTTAFIELTYKAVSPEKIKDKSTGYKSNTVTAELVLNHKDDKLTDKSTKLLYTDIDTEAKVTSASSEKGYPYEVYPDIFPEELKPANEADYVYADYVYYMSHEATQPFNLKFKAMAESYGGKILGVRDSSNNKIIKGNDTSSLEFDVDIPDNFKKSGDRQNYMRVFVAFPANQFTQSIVYDLKVRGQYSITSMDDKQTSTKYSISTVPYKPIKFVAPDNHFGIDKNGDGRKKMWNGDKYEGEYNYGLNQLSLGRDLDILYNTRVIAFNLPFTYPSWDPKNNNKDDSLDNYRQRQFTTEVVDGKLETKFADVDYEIKSLEMTDLTLYDYVKYPSSGNGYFEGATGKIEYGFIPIGQFGYKSKARLSDFEIKDKSYTFQILGTTDGTNYTAYANVNIDSGINIEPINGAAKEGNKLIFPSGIQQYKAAIKSGIPGYTYTLKPTITIKANEKSKKLADDRIANMDLPLERFKTNGDMVGITDTNQKVQSKPEYAHDRVYGLVSGTKLSTGLSYTNDTENARVKVDYVVRMDHQTNQTDLKDLQEAIDLGIIKEEKEATWYNLLPEGFDLNANSVKAKNGNSIISKEIIKNYKNTNRDLLIVKVKQTPNYKMKFKSSYNNASIIGLDGYADVPEITYSGTYSWTMMRHYAIKNGGQLDYRLTSDHVYKSANTDIGNLKGYLSENSSASEKRNKYTTIDDLVKDIDGVDNNNSYLFEHYSKSLSVDTYALVGAEKLVDVNFEGDYTMGTSSSEEKKAYENSYYTYRITLATDEKSEASNLIIYDKIDGYELSKENDAEFGSKTFKGTYNDVNLAMAKSLGVEPKIYYSTKEDIDINYDKPTADMDIKSSVWTTVRPSNDKDIKAIAIDLSTKVNGQKFILGKNESIMSEIIVKAPKLSETSLDAYAFNKAVVTFTNADGADGSKNLAATQKTKVGIKPFYITVRGKYDDDNDRDGKRPDNIKVQLLKNGQPVGETVTLDNTNELYKEFDGVEYQDATGKVYDYSFKVIDGSKDYEYIISAPKKYDDRLEFDITAKHEPEKITVQGQKIWQGKKINMLKRYEEPITSRPGALRVTLNKNDESYKSTMAVPDKDGNWYIKFENEFKYEKGKEIKYTLSEDEYIPGYIPPEYSQDGLTITNNYYPFGDLTIKNELIDATSKAEQSYFEYEITIQTLNSNGSYSVNMNSYSYTTEKGTKGTISTGGIIRTESVNGKPGDVFIKDLPSESKIIVKQIEKPGFRTDKYEQEIGIKAGRGSELQFVNRYSTKGEVALKSKKIVNGKKLEPFMFLFDLMNNNGEVIQSVRNDSKGEVYFEPIQYSLKNIDKANSQGELKYTVKERNDGRKGYQYDTKEYQVTVKLQDNGDGTITTTPIYKLNSKTVEIPEFTNIYKAVGNFDFTAFKEIKYTTVKPAQGTVEYTVYKEDGTVLAKATNDDNGVIKLNKAKTYTEKDIDKTFIYTIKETDLDETLFEKNTDYIKISETVKDNGDGTLSVDQKYLGRFDSTNKRIDEKNNTIPKLINIGKKSDLMVEKKVQGDYKDPDKLFKFKITFTGDKENIPKQIKVVRKKTSEVASRSSAETAVNGILSLMNNSVSDVLKSYVAEKLDIAAENIPEAVGATGKEKGYVANLEAGWEAYEDTADPLNMILEVTNSYKDGLIAIFNANNGETLKFQKQYKPKTVLTAEDKFPGNINNWGNPGLIIKGWSTNKNATKPEYKVGAVIKDSDIYTKRSTADATLNQVQLYAVWGKPGFVVEFNKNGGNGSMTNQEIGYDTETKLNENTFYYVGKRFVGWSTKPAGPVEYASKADIKKAENEVTNDKLVLYAIWEDADLNLNSDNGTFEFTLKDGETAILKDIPPYLNYTIEEIPDPAWGLVANENASGTTAAKDNKKASFTNEYGAKSATLQFSGTKYINGKASSLDEFKFELTDVTRNKTYVTKADNLTGAFNFEYVVFNKPGSYTFRIKELDHNNPNYTKDNNVFEYHIKVYETDQGGLTAKIDDNYSLPKPTKFYNNSKSANIVVTKELTGQWLDDTRAFRFKATIDGAPQEFTLKKGENKTINAKFGSTYEIEELSNGHWTTVATNKKGIVDKSTINVKFVNESTLTDAPSGEQPTQVISFNKRLSGRTLEDKEFMFKVELKNGTSSLATYNASNDANGKIEVEIPSIMLKQAKTLEVSEIIPTGAEADENVIYDTHKFVYNITQKSIATEFDILDNNGKTVEETAKFVNKVKPGKLDISLKLNNATDKVKDTEFKVKVVYGDKVKELIMKNGDNQSLDIPADINYQITVEDLQEGFKLVDITNDSGVMKAGTTINSLVTIEYNTQTEFSMVAKKQMVDINDNDAKELLDKYVFDFMMVDEEGNVIGRASNDNEGNITFNSINFGIEDIGKTYKYQVVELENGQFNIVFDKSMFEVEVKVEDTGKGIKATPTIKQINGENSEVVQEIKFVNKYKEEIPVPITGFNKSIITIIVMSISMLVGIYFSIRKKLKSIY